MGSALLAWLADAMIVLGAVTSGIAILGLIRLPDIYTRIHAASKVAVLGVIPVLLASLATADPAFIQRAALIAALLILTTPVAAHAIARAGYLEGVPADRYPASRDGPPEGAVPAAGSHGSDGASQRGGERLTDRPLPDRPPPDRPPPDRP